MSEAPEPTGGALHVTAAAVTRDGRVLVARRTRPAALAGLWEFPGGKVEAGEPPRAALARELDEELGIVVEVGAYLDRSVATAGERALALDAYGCVLADSSSEPRPDERDGTHDAVRWVTPEELRELAATDALAPADVPLVAAVVRWVASRR